MLPTPRPNWLNRGELDQLAERILVGLAGGGGGDDDVPVTPDYMAANAFLAALAFMRVRASVRGCGHEDLEEMLYRIRNDAVLQVA
jgi:hypothetical protein